VRWSAKSTNCSTEFTSETDEAPILAVTGFPKDVMHDDI